MATDDDEAGEVSLLEILGLMIGGFVGIVLLGIGGAFWAGVLFDVPPPARAETAVEAVEDPDRITAEEIAARWRPDSTRARGR